MPQTFAKVEQSLSQAIQKESVTRDIRQGGRLIRTVGPILSAHMLFLRVAQRSFTSSRNTAWLASVSVWCQRPIVEHSRLLRDRQGTLAPWDPPKKLVTVGLYRFVRNPIYIGVVGYVLGWSLIAGSRRMAVYAAVLAVGFHLRVVFYEEPTLARLFGNEWYRYRANVNRWWPRRPSKRRKGIV